VVVNKFLREESEGLVEEEMSRNDFGIGRDVEDSCIGKRRSEDDEVDCLSDRELMHCILLYPNERNLRLKTYTAKLSDSSLFEESQLLGVFSCSFWISRKSDFKRFV
jgi:hypothetical protein